MKVPQPLQLILSLAAPFFFPSPVSLPHQHASSPGQLASHGSALKPVTTFSSHPLLPPAIPLAVKSPYVNCWLPVGGAGGSGGLLAGSWAKHWPVAYPGSGKAYTLGWAGLIKVDNETYEFLGDPISDDIGTRQIAHQLSFEYTATRSKFTVNAGGVTFNVTFLTPVTPNDLLRTSVPLSYLEVEVDPKLLQKHSVVVYTDITGQWASGDGSAPITWSYDVGNTIGMYEIKREEQMLFSEIGEQAEWGAAVYGTKMRHGVSTASGWSKELRSTFVHKGHLNGSQDVDYRRIDDRQPAFGFSVALSVQEPMAVFTVGHIRSPYVNYVTSDGQVSRKGLWTTRFDSGREVVAFWLDGHADATQNATYLDELVHKDAVRTSGHNYSAVATLSVRQAFATFEVTVGSDPADVLLFLKEISSNGDMSTVDVIFPLYPILTYMNPLLLKLLLEPLMIYSASGLYPNRWTVHDLGTYPNATGYNQGNDEPMPVEEAGNMLWMILAYYQLTEDVEWIKKYYGLLTQWTTYLIDDGLVPAEQLSTDDFAGTLSNQTNLAVKAIVGIGAMAELAKLTGHWVDSVHYRATAEAYVSEWYDLALTARDWRYPHAKLSYQDEDSHGLLYNLFGDRVLNLQLFDHLLYRWQNDFYWTQKNEYGVPLDSRHPWTKTDWECFASASATDKKTRDMFNNLLVAYLKAGKVDAGFPDLYETTTANFPGREGLDWAIQFIARPVVGGHFALLALEVANKANGVHLDPFSGKPNSSRGTSHLAAKYASAPLARQVRWQRETDS